MGRWTFVIGTMLGAALIIILNTSTAIAADVPQSFTLDGRLYSDAAGATPLQDGAISFTVQILDDAKVCVVYEESQIVSTVASKGYFSMQVGTVVGSPLRTAGDSANSMPTIFQNMSTINGKLLSNGAPCTVSATGGNRRYVRIKILPPSMGGIARTLSPDLTIDSVPNAIVAERAESLQGLRATNVLQVNTASGSTLSQSNLESLFTSTARFNSLSSVVDGTSVNYMRTNSTSGANLPVMAGAPTSPVPGAVWYDSSDSKLKFQTSVGPVTVGTGAGTVTSVGFTAPSELSVTGAPVTTTGTIAVTWATQTANKVFAAPDGATGTPSFRLMTSGDIPNLPWTKITSLLPTTLLGYGITDAVRNVGGTPSLQSGLNAAKGAATTAGRVWISTDTKEIYRDNGATWDLIGSGSPTGGTVTSVSSTNSYMSVATATTTPALTVNVGAVANTVAAGDDARITGALPAATAFAGDVSGVYSATSVDKIKGTGVAITALGTGNFLRYNGTNWVNSNLTSGDVTTGLTYTPLNKAGDTMTGLLVLSADPAANLGASTKQYVDSSTTSAAANYLRKDATVALTADWDVDGAGAGTRLITGLASPVAGDGAATKTYADTKFITRDLPAVPAVGQNGQSIRWNNAGAAWEYYTPSTGNGDFLADGTIPMTGTLKMGGNTINGNSTASGNLTLDSTSNAAKGYVLLAPTTGNVGVGNVAPGYKLDVTGDVNISGNYRVNGTIIGGGSGTVTSVSSANSYLSVATGTTTPALTLNVGVAANTVAAGDDSRITGALPAATAFAGDVSGVYSATSVDKIKGTAVSITAITSGNFLKYNGTNWVNSNLAAGDVTGALTYNPVNKAGDTMTGLLVLSADPSAALGAATKQYVDTAGTTAATKFMTKDLPAVPAVGQNGQVLRWNNTTPAWEFYTPTTGNGTVTSVTSGNAYMSVASGTTTPALTLNVGAAANTLAAGDDSRITGALQSATAFAGDVSGVYSATSVDKIKGTGVAITALGTGNFLRYNGTNWVNTNLSAGDVTTGLTYTPVNKAGDTMTGLLVLSADPSAALGASTKQYVDSSTTTAAANYLRKDATVALTADWDTDGAGAGTRKITGLASPTDGDGAATKTYADSKFITKDLPAAPAVGQNGQSLRWNNGTSAWEYYTSGNGSVTSVSSANSYLSVATGTTTPALTLNVGVAANTVAAGDDSRITGALQSATSFAGDVSGVYSATSVDKIKGTGVAITAITSGNFLKYNGTNWVNSNLAAGDVTTALTYTPVNKAGDTMTGLLVLSADPSSALGAATKQYTDSSTSTAAANYLRKDATVALTADWDVDGVGAGTRLITGLAAPVAGDGAATKNYADTKFITGTLPAAPAVGQNGQSIRWNNGTTAWEYYTPGGSLSGLTPASATNTIDNLNFAQTWNWSTATTQSPMSISANALTTGSLLNLTTSSASVNSTNGLLNVANSSATTTGVLARFQANSTAGSGMTILNSGNVGVGTASPQKTLDVRGSFRVATDGGFTNSEIDGSTPYLTFNSYGGTVASPTYPLDGATLGGIEFGNQTGNFGALIEAKAVGNHGSGPNRSGGKLDFYTSPSGTNNAAIRMTISDSGNVGIGTINPTSVLHAYDATAANASGQNVLTVTGVMTAATVGSGPKIIFRENTTGNPAAAVRAYSFGAASTGLAFETGWNAITPKMVIDNAGNVGIGTTNPTYPLHIVMNSNTSTGVVETNSSAGASAQTANTLFNNNSDYFNFGITSSGNVTIPGQ